MSKTAISPDSDQLKRKMTKAERTAKGLAAIKRGGYQFKPGQSGNPSGRPKSFGAAVEMMRAIALDPNNIDKIKKLLNSKSEQIRLKTLEFVHTRAFGAPAQAVMMRLIGEQDAPTVLGDNGYGLDPDETPAPFIFNPDDPEQQRRALDVGRLLLALGAKVACNATAVEAEHVETNGATKSPRS